VFATELPIDTRPYQVATPPGWPPPLLSERRYRHCCGWSGGTGGREAGFDTPPSGGVGGGRLRHGLALGAHLLHGKLRWRSWFLFGTESCSAI